MSLNTILLIILILVIVSPKLRKMLNGTLTFLLANMKSIIRWFGCLVIGLIIIWAISMLLVLLVILIRNLYLKHTTEFISYVVISVIVIISYNLSKKKVNIKNQGSSAISPRTKFILYFLLNISLWVIIIIAIAMGTAFIIALFSRKL